MGKRLIGHLVIQLLIVITVAAMAAFTALVSMGGIGGVAMGVEPEFTFGLVADFVCPEGTLDYYSIQRSYHEPGESEPHLECVAENGESEDVLLQAIGAGLGLSFVAGFLIVTGGLLLFYKRQMGCVTGDMLGAMTEVNEAALFLLAAAGAQT